MVSPREREKREQSNCGRIWGGGKGTEKGEGGVVGGGGRLKWQDIYCKFMTRRNMTIEKGIGPTVEFQPISCQPGRGQWSWSTNQITVTMVHQSEYSNYPIRAKWPRSTNQRLKWPLLINQLTVALSFITNTVVLSPSYNFVSNLNNYSILNILNIFV